MPFSGPVVQGTCERQQHASFRHHPEHKMNFYRPAFSNLAFSALVLTALLTPAHARDTTVGAQRPKALLAKQGMERSWTGISGNASRMGVEGASMASGGQDAPSGGAVT